MKVCAQIIHLLKLIAQVAGRDSPGSIQLQRYDSIYQQCRKSQAHDEFVERS